MESALGQALEGFERAYADLRQALSGSEELTASVFGGTQGWSDLLSYKLVPHLSGGGCLMAIIAGGTNTGKSTVFNLLLGSATSVAMTTAAATCHPVLAASPSRFRQCLEGKLVPEFRPRRAEYPTQMADPAIEKGILFVAETARLPDHLALMDTPDIDSIDKENWAIAEHIRAAGDVVIAILTGEKYRDERVVRFFQEAHNSGRVVIPLMNKANPGDGYEIARRQIEEFRSDVGTEEPSFVLPHDFALSEDYGRPIPAMEEGPDLNTYIKALPVHEIKQKVFAKTVTHFAVQAQGFIHAASGVGETLREIVDQAESLARAASQEYDPAPGAAMGGLFHGFVQAKRGRIRRTIGAASAAVTRGVTAVGRRVGKAFTQRATLSAVPEDTEAVLYAHHERIIAGIVQGLAADYIKSSRNLNDPAGGLIVEFFDRVDIDSATGAIVRSTLSSDNISESFKQHAQETLENWWEDHKGKRLVLEALDGVLAIMPAAIAAPIALHTGGLGASEAVIIAGPLAAQFATRVMEYQFGDAMFDFLSPWRAEQCEALEHALLEHLTKPGYEGLYTPLEALEGKIMTHLKTSLAQCQTV